MQITQERVWAKSDVYDCMARDPGDEVYISIFRNALYLPRDHSSCTADGLAGQSVNAIKKLRERQGARERSEEKTKS